jgi:hypothetical protein
MPMLESLEPLSGTIDFWDRWAEDADGAALAKAVESWRREALVK